MCAHAHTAAMLSMAWKDRCFIAPFGSLSCTIHVSTAMAAVAVAAAAAWRRPRQLLSRRQRRNHRYVCGMSSRATRKKEKNVRCRQFKTGFAWDSGHERTFSKLPKVIQVQWKLPKQKDFYILINGSFNHNRLSLRSNVSGGFRASCLRLPPSRWRCRRK